MDTLPEYAPASLETCPPLYATAPTPHARTLGHELAAVSEMLGHALLPWQRYVADVALELDDTGHLRYRDITLTVPRQSGKSWLLLVVLLHRMLVWPTLPQQTVYCSQSIFDGLNLWRRSLWPVVEQSGLAQVAGMRLRRGAGDAGVDCESGSGLRLLSASPSSGHGVTCGLAVIDEAFHFVDASKEQALLPALRTVPDSQLWVVSTAGGETSTYLHARMDAGRSRCESGVHGTAAYMEWGAPESADWSDPTVWISALPALGHTQTLATVEHEYQTTGEAEFRRAALNQRPAENVHDTCIPWERWTAVCDPDHAVPLEMPVVLAADGPPRRGSASIVAAGGGVCEIVRHSEGVSWVLDSLLSICDTQPVERVVLMSGGPLEHLVDTLRAHGVDVLVTSWARLAGACGRLHDDVISGSVRVRRSERVDDALLSADVHQRGGSWHYKQRPYGQTISPLIALTLAHDESTRLRDVPPPATPSVSGAATYESDPTTADEYAEMVERWRSV